MIDKLIRTLVAVAVVLLASTALADTNPLHNFKNPYDVDDNTLVTPRDLLLIVNQIHRQETSDLEALIVEMETKYFWDTTNDTRITPHDALLVVNHMTAATPEPSTYAMAGAGLIALAGYCCRRRKPRKATS